MNYEKKYKEALERCRKEFNFNNLAYSHEEIRERLEHVFPELKDNEDEKIRKELLYYIKQEKNYIESQVKPENSPKLQFLIDAISWLEKQGKKDSQVILPTFTFDDILALQCCMKKAQKDEELYNQLQNLHDRLHDAYWLEKQGEQKPKTKPALEVWKDMRFEVYQQASGNRHEPNCSDDSTKMFSLTDIDEIFEKVAEKQCEKNDDKIVEKSKTEKQRVLLTETNGDANINWDCRSMDDVEVLLNCGLEYIRGLKTNKQKPTDKVEPKFKVGDVMRTLQEAANGITDGMPVVVSIDEKYYHCTSELISIKYQDIYEYPPINRRQNFAWSEEDEKFLNLSLENLAELKNRFGEKYGKVGDCILWLKSLKERYTWKPSDEQMEALYTYIYNPQYFNSPDQRMELVESVYKDLKKLREE